MPLFLTPGRLPLSGRIKRVPLPSCMLSARLGPREGEALSTTEWVKRITDEMVPMLRTGWSEMVGMRQGDGECLHTTRCIEGLPEGAALIFMTASGIIEPTDPPDLMYDLLFECDAWEWIEPGEPVPVLTPIYTAEWKPLQVYLAEQKQKEQDQGTHAEEAKAPAVRPADAVAARRTDDDTQEQVHNR